MDATYRADLRELNELNFARFDAKREQRLAEYDAKWEQRIAQLDSKWEHRLSRLEVKLATDLATQKAELMKWMFALWATLIIPILGLWFRG